VHPRYRRGRGPGILGRIRRDNVGKIPLAAGAGHKLQRLLKRGTTEGEKRGMGLAHESVRATKEGQCPLRRRQVRAPWQRGSGHLAVSKPAGFSDNEPGYNHVGNETRLRANRERRSVCVPALKTSPRVGKAHGGNARVSNRTWENRPSGIIGGLRKRGHGGNENPARNRKSRLGNPPPIAGAPELYPNL
jgi:hypothetical protein